MELEVTLEPSDFCAWQAFVKQSAGLSIGLRDFLGGIVVGVLLVLVTKFTNLEFHYLSAGFTLAVVGALTLHFSHRVRSRLVPDATGVILGPHRYTIDKDGFRVTTPHYQATYSWSAIKSWPETQDHLFIKLDRVAAIIVPKRAFADPSQQMLFLTELEQRAA